MEDQEIKKRKNIIIDDNSFLDPNEYGTIINKVRSAREALLTWYRMMKEKRQRKAAIFIGGMEGLAIKYGLAKMDKDGDGKITYREYEEYIEDAKLMMDKATNLLLNSGVVGALFISFLYPQLFSSISISQESQNFFGDKFIQIIIYFYYGMLMTSVTCGILLVFLATRIFIFMNFWINSTDSKLSYLHEIPFVLISLLAIWTILTAIWTIPFAVAITVKPGVALLTIIMVVFTHLVGFVYIERNIFGARARIIAIEEVELFMKKIIALRKDQSIVEDPSDVITIWEY